MERVPIHKLADIFVASFEISFEEQLSILDSIDPKVRLSEATMVSNCGPHHMIRLQYYNCGTCRNRIRPQLQNFLNSRLYSEL